VAKLPVASGADVVRALGRLGFVQVSQRGSHVKLRRESRTVIVPMHPEIAQGTLRSILRQADISAEQLSAALS
jgi:predicted RNA binding protein YcfA (HicA-like mRNA interferase family)